MVAFWITSYFWTAILKVESCIFAIHRGVIDWWPEYDLHMDIEIPSSAIALHKADQALFVIGQIPLGALVVVCLAAFLAWTPNPQIGKICLRFRTRPRTRVAFACFCVSLLVCWALSLGREMGAQIPFARAAVATGQVHFAWNPSSGSDKKSDAVRSADFDLWCREAMMRSCPGCEQGYYMNSYHTMNGINLLWPFSIFVSGFFLMERGVREARKGHLCHRCGYNLTGNVSGRCPECGTICKPH